VAVKEVSSLNEYQPTPSRPHCPGQHGQPHLAGGCRCLIDATPTHQFIRSLAAIGWPLREQGRLLGQRYGRNFRVLTRQRIERGTALRVGWLYTRLWDVPGPSPRAVATAARLGWRAPDPVVVARLVAGIDCPHTTADRDQAVRVLTARGQHTVTAIANRLRMSPHTVRAIQHQGGWALGPTATVTALAA
jgi:hypothetical protein